MMNGYRRVLWGVCVVVLVTGSCGKKEGPKVRVKSFLSVEEPVKVSGLLHPAIVRDADGTLLMTTFIHSTFPSATEAREAIAVFESGDEGATWAELSRIASFNTNGVWGYDLAMGKGGGLYMTWVAGVYGAETPQPHKAVMFSRSEDGGRSWTEPVVLSQPTVLQRRSASIAVNGDDVCVVWLCAAQPARGATGRARREDVYLSSSADGGETWSEEKCLEESPAGKLSGSGVPSVAAGADGSVHAAYFLMRQRTKRKRVGGFCIGTSTDGGETFSTKLHDVGALGDVQLAAAEGTLYLAVVSIKGIRQISMDSPKTSQEIHLYVSSDGGSGWDGPYVVDDDERDRHKSSLRLASAGGGRLIACWDDERGGVYMAASVDGGESWGKNVKVAGSSPVGNAVLDMAVDVSSGMFYLVVGHIRMGKGDAIYLVRGKVAP